MSTLPEVINQESITEKELQSALLNLVDLHVRKEYLNEIEATSVVPLNSKQKSIVPEKNMRLFHIEKLSYSVDTKVSDKIKVIFESLTEDCGSVVFFVNGKKNHVDLYMGVCAQKTDKLAGQYALNYGAFQAVYPGSESKRLKNSENGALIKDFFPENEKLSVAALSGVPMNDYEQNTASIEHLDSLVDAMKHKPFTLMVIAQPISHQELLLKRRELENLYSEIYPYQKQDISLSQNESQSFGKNFSTTLTKSSSISTGTSSSHTEGSTEGTSEQELPDNSDSERSNAASTLIGMGIATAVTLATGVPAPGGATAAAGAADVMRSLFFGGSIGNIINSAKTLAKDKQETPTVQLTKNESHNKSETYSEQTNKTEGESESTQEGTNESESRTSGKTVQVSYINKPVVDLLNLIDAQIAELNEAEKIPMFNVGTYFLAGDEETAVSAADIYRSIVSSYGSVQKSPNVYKWSDTEAVSDILEYLKRGLHPKFSFEADGIYPQMSIAQPVKSDDMPAYFCLPERTIPGINVVKHAAFTRDVIYRDKPNEDNPDEKISIGNICYMGKEDPETPVTFPINELTKHMFVAGATGVGKSNYCYQLIDTLIKQGKKVLVIEPAKGEYSKVFGGRDGFKVYGTNINVSQLLRINPFAFPEGISVAEHIEALMDIFNNAWPMYSAMPAILKDALERIYENNGFDLTYQIRTGEEVFPTFKDLLEELPKLIKDSEYSKEVQGNYIGALVTRIKSMTNGVYGTIFCRNEIGDEKLFDGNVIIDISRIRSNETKALIMGILINRLSEYRMCSGTMNSPLLHITLLEEAHHLLRKHSSSAVEGADMRGASVEMISNAIAEMRTYGEGFVIADQSPAIMDHSVIANTQTKVFFMLPEREDRSVASSSLELNAEQQSELARLPVGTAVVYQNAWAEPVMAKINPFDKSLMEPYNYTPRNILQDNKDIISQAFATLLYRRITAENKVGSYDEDKINEIIQKDYSWLGDVEFECKQIFNQRDEILQSKIAASRISSLYSLISDFGNQLSKFKKSPSLTAWLQEVKAQINKLVCLTEDEINELIGVLIFNSRTLNSDALKLHGEYLKTIEKTKEGNYENK